MVDKLLQYVIFTLMCVVLMYVISILNTQQNTQDQINDIQTKIADLHGKFEWLEVEAIREE